HVDQLPRAPGDDRDHRSPDAVENALHPREPAVAEVERREREHHEERRQDEGDAHQRRPGHAGAHPSEVDRELRRERPRRELREGEPLDVVLPRDPAALVDEVALHVADERDRSAEAECAEAEEIAEQLTEAARRRRGRHRLGRRGRWGDGHGLFPSGATVRPSNSGTESAFVHSPTLRGSAKVWSCASTTFSTASTRRLATWSVPQARFLRKYS